MSVSSLAVWTRPLTGGAGQEGPGTAGGGERDCPLYEGGDL